jgi:hypothetical protein
VTAPPPPGRRTSRGRLKVSNHEMQLSSTITCPSCGYRSTGIMPTDACQFFYDCGGCDTRIKPKADDCCVFCSFGDVPCPRSRRRAPMARQQLVVQHRGADAGLIDDQINEI